MRLVTWGDGVIQCGSDGLGWADSTYSAALFKDESWVITSSSTAREPNNTKSEQRSIYNIR